MPGTQSQSERSAAVERKIGRIAAIWSTPSAPGPWLFGDFCAADIMFAAMAARFQNCGVALDGPPAAYMDRLLRHPHVTEWFSLGEAETVEIEQFELPSR